MRFRRHTIRQLEAMLPHIKDEARFIAMAKQGRQQLEELFAQERQSAQRARHQGWSDKPPGEG
jgi:glutathione-regulated potassium-efflux system ancillary protein KefC